MKKFTFTFVFFLQFVQASFGVDGELWFAIKDYENTDYFVVARRISINDPLFGDYFQGEGIMELNTNQFNIIVSDKYFGGSAPGYNIIRGFNLLLWSSPDPLNYPHIGAGKLELSIYQGIAAAEKKAANPGTPGTKPGDVKE